MPPNSEIEKLERRWKENPKGTVFAPYAEVLRKHGDYPVAKDVLRQGLELHPDHIPGNIVLGRCCLDLGEEGPAEAAFVHVLDLDVENVIALKALADITERQGRLMEAANWLARLIAVDPSNDEARDQLARVDAAREAASAAMVAPPPPASPVAETTEVRMVIQPPTPASLEPTPPAVAESGIGAGSGRAVDTDAVVDAVLGGFEESSILIPPPPAKPFDFDDVTEPMPIRPLPGNEPRLAGLVPGGLDLADAAASIESEDITGLTPDEPFQAPPAPSAPPPPEVYPIGLEEPAAIDLSPAGSTEFQAPDDGAALLDLTPGRSSEFQELYAADELRLSGTAASEYQSASGAEELLRSVEADALLAPAPGYLEPPPPPPLDIPTSGFAAIALMPTEELPTTALPEANTPLEAESEPAPAQSVVEMLAAASSQPPASPPELATADAEPEVASAGGNALHLIFPEDASEPEPPRVRRITEEIVALGERESAEAVGEPAPVMTETMAELYARQGHVAEALNVYRVLAVRMPNDARLAQRIRELEAAQSSGGRRMSYVAVDTGGESVESFFRSLSDARPAGVGEPVHEGNDSAGGAPTRPASDALSLSALFGEDGSAAASPGAGEPPARPGNPDSFSFDQFFGGSATASSSTGQRPAMPSDEDLDQFQNWLKSLKR